MTQRALSSVTFEGSLTVDGTAATTVGTSGEDTTWAAQRSGRVSGPGTAPTANTAPSGGLVSVEAGDGGDAVVNADAQTFYDFARALFAGTLPADYLDDWYDEAKHGGDGGDLYIVGGAGGSSAATGNGGRGGDVWLRGGNAVDTWAPVFPPYASRDEGEDGGHVVVAAGVAGFVGEPWYVGTSTGLASGICGNVYLRGPTYEKTRHWTGVDDGTGNEDDPVTIWILINPIDRQGTTGEIMHVLGGYEGYFSSNYNTAELLDLTHGVATTYIAQSGPTAGVLAEQGMIGYLEVMPPQSTSRATFIPTTGLIGTYQTYTETCPTSNRTSALFLPDNTAGMTVVDTWGDFVFTAGSGFTIAFWFKTPAVLPALTFAVLTKEVANSWRITLSNALVLTFVVGAAGGVGDPTVALALDTVYCLFIVGQELVGNTVVSIYVNNDVGAGVPSATSAYVWLPLNWDATGDFHIGTDVAGGYCTGDTFTIDELRVWTTALAPLVGGVAYYNGGAGTQLETIGAANLAYGTHFDAHELFSEYAGGVFTGHPTDFSSLANPMVSDVRNCEQASGEIVALDTRG